MAGEFGCLLPMEAVVAWGSLGMILITPQYLSKEYRRMEPGIVSAIPDVTRPSKYGIDWDKYAWLAKQSGRPVLAGKNIVDSQIKSIRQYTRDPFNSLDGYIAVHMRNSRINPDDGKRYGDVYFDWVAD